MHEPIADSDANHDRPTRPISEVDDRPREACGVFGIWAPEVDVAVETFYGIHTLQHRGQESAGICTTDGRQLNVKTGMGLVAQVFDEETAAELEGIAAIGHTRYSTTGSSRFRNAQPILLDDPVTGNQVAIAHNGNVVNAAQVRVELTETGATFETSTDTEVLAKYLLLFGKDEADTDTMWQARFSAVMRHIEVAYSLVLLTPDRLMAARDPYGVRPLCIGQVGGRYVVASETCALDQLGATLLREVRPGELVTIDERGMRSYQAIEPAQPAGCVFEHIYFARPDSILDGQAAWQSRSQLGVELAREHPADADVVIGVPDSATAHAIGYSFESGIPYSEGLVKNRYVGRTFISPDQRLRDLGAHLKYNPMPSVLGGRRVVVVDDTIVRGTTTPRIVKLLREAGAAEIHMRIAAPPIQHPCHFGVDMATRGELIAARNSVEAIREHIGADSLGYLSIGGLQRALSLGKTTCLACFNGDYPVSVQTDFEIDTLSVPLVTAGSSTLATNGNGNGNGNGRAPKRSGRPDETMVALAPERR